VPWWGSAIVTDSTADLPPGLTGARAITVVPLTLNLDLTFFPDGSITQLGVASQEFKHDVITPFFASQQGGVDRYLRPESVILDHQK